MIKKLIVSLLIITSVGATSVYATKALLSDPVTLTANTFSTGTVDLQITVGSDAYADSHTGFTDTVFPGQTKSKFFKLKNNASGIPLTIAAQAANTSGLPGDKVTVAFTPWTTSTTGGHAETGAVTTSHTLAEWLANPAELGIPNIPSTTGNTGQDYRMDVSIDPSINTSGGNTSFDFVFTGTQVNPTPSTSPSPSPSSTP